jgi:hypothetical protein
MKLQFSPDLLPPHAILLACSSHEPRCRGLLSRLGGWKPKEAVIFHYDDPNPRREENHREMEAELRAASVVPLCLQFTEQNAVRSLFDNMATLRGLLRRNPNLPIVLDFSVFTKRHLLMTLQWLDDEGFWDHLCIVYSEPEDYEVSEFIPLSFGLASLQEVPGFSASADLSRPLHLVLFLGYEGDRALAVYEHIQPMQTTLVVPNPPYKPAWVGRTEKFNADLIAVVGEESKLEVDAIDPEATRTALAALFGDGTRRGHYAKMVSPLGTKPQALGVYSFVRGCADPPAVVYASPLRHNHEFFSHGIGTTWILKRPS